MGNASMPTTRGRREEEQTVTEVGYMEAEPVPRPEEVAALRAALDALRASQERYRSVIENVSEVVFHLDTAACIEFLTPSWVEVSGHPIDAALGRPLPDFAQVDDREVLVRALQESLEQRQPVQQLVRFTAADATVKLLELRCRPVLVGRDATGLVGTLDDVTERQRLQMELLQAQKLESVGRLASGIAHEINTPIQFVGDNLHFLAESFSALVELLQGYRACLVDDETSWEDRQDRMSAAEAATDLDYLAEEVPQAVAQALEGTRRVADIVQAMKAFGHPDRAEQQAVDLNAGLRSTLTVARNELKYVADVETDLGDLPPVICHPGDLNQVFLNLLVNAAHAIADTVGDSGGRGRITVRSRREGDDVIVSIADTGTGIPPAVAAKVFDPFFTTKAMGKGTGQGLALSKSVVVEKHGGALTFETSPGEGTTFFIRLPISSRLPEVER